MPHFALARTNMVENQLKPNEVGDARLLAAMGRVPRETFVPAALRPVAYLDEDIRLPDGFLIEPLGFAKLVQSARIEPGEVVLLIGDTTGYAAAVLADLAGTVLVIDDDEARLTRLNERLDQLEVANVVPRHRPDLRDGYPDQAPFDSILILGEVDEVPAALTAQLAEGGRLVTARRRGPIGRVTVFTRVGETVTDQEVADAQLPECAAFRQETGFVF